MIKKYLYTLAALIFLISGVVLFRFWRRDFDPEKLRPQDRLFVSLAKLTDFIYLPLMFGTNNLPVYEVFVPALELQSVFDALPAPFSNTILESGQSQKADGKLKVNGQEYEIKLSVRGDLPNHWSLPQKSWQVELKGGQNIEGTEELNFIIPSDRRLLFGIFGLHLAEKFELVVPKNWMGVLKINNRSQGVYFIRESNNGVMLERNQRADGDIYKEKDDPNNYDSKGQSVPGSKKLWQDPSAWKKVYDSGIFPDGDKNRLQTLIGLLNQNDAAVFEEEIGKLIDLDYFFRWQALALLLGSYHQDNFHNQNLYHNPASGRLEILPKEYIQSVKLSVTKKHNQLVDRILSIEKFRQRRDQVLLAYLTEENLLDDLEYFENLFVDNRSAFYRDHMKFLSNYGFDYTTKKQMADYETRFRYLQQELSARADNVQETPEPLNTKIWQGNLTFTKNQIIEPGIHLIIRPGTVINLYPAVSIISYGPVTAVGSAALPIKIRPASDQPWGVFAVIGPHNQPSHFSYADVSGGSQATISGILATGALAVHYADVEVDHSSFTNNHGDDGLNVKHSQSNITDSLFRDNDFDGLDLDFTTGLVTNNQFINHGNDGLDLGSTSNIIKNNVINTAQDKCLSLGEESVLLVENNVLENCRIGIAVKDASRPTIINNRLIGNKIGISHYQKKSLFPLSDFIEEDNVFSNNEADFGLAD